MAELLPAGFEVYLRLFHPWVQVDEQTAAPSRKAWHQVAAELGAPYGPAAQLRKNGWPITGTDSDQYWLDEGELEPLTAAALIDALGKTTSPNEPVYFVYDLPVVVRGMAATFFRASLADFPAVRAAMDEIAGVTGGEDDRSVPGPEMFWPVNQRWIVYTDYDLCSTYVGCDEVTGRALFSSPGLEVLPVTLSTRIDIYADDEASI